jgi:hypothetical protein
MSGVDLSDAASVLYKLGFNVVPVDENKKPVGSWNVGRRLPWDQLKALLGKAGGLAVTGSYLEDNDFGVVILDLDDVDAANEVLSKVFSEEWRARLCGQGWSFCGLTGPRPKGKVVCDCKSPGEDCECVVQDTGERKKLSELKRGMYIVVRVPKHCLPRSTARFGAVEVLVTNYEVVYGKHPSGVFYQPVRFVDGNWVPIGINEVDKGEVITCEELHALVALLSGGGREVTPEELGGGDAATAVELNLPEPTLELPRDKAQLLINTVASLWWVTDNEGKHYHDLILYGLSSLMRRAGVKYESAREVVEGIINTAIKNLADRGVKDEELRRIQQQEERHIRETLDHAYGRYGKNDPRLWGRESFEDALRDFVRLAHEQGATPYEPIEFFSIVYDAIGYRIDTILCVPIQRLSLTPLGGDVGIEEIGRETWTHIEFICNDPPYGVVHRRKRKVTRKVPGEDGEAVEVEYFETKDSALLKWSFKKIETYYDPYFDIAYANAVVQNEVGVVREYSMIKVDTLTKELEKERGLVKPIPRWDVILQSIKPKALDVIVSGFVCPPPDLGLPCGVRDYFDVGLARAEYNPDLARDAIKAIIDIAYKYHPDPDAFLRGVVYGAFTNFSLTWKMHGFKPKMVALVGEYDSGKTTVGYILNWMFSPRIDAVLPTSILLSPARAGRGVELLTNAVVTTPVTFDEAGTSVERGVVKLEGNTANVLKNYVTQKYTWVTATGTKVPATSGVVLTANQLAVTDPALEEKIAFVNFAHTIPPRNRELGTAELRSVKNKLVFFGKYYLQYAVENWSNIKDIVMGSDWEKSAIMYFNTVLQSLGIAPLNLTIEEKQRPTYLYMLRSLLQSYVREHQTVCMHGNEKVDFWQCLEYLIEYDYIPFIKLHRTGEDITYYRITREIKNEMGIDTKILCQELGGEYLGRDKTRNTKYIGSCVLEKYALFDALGATPPHGEQNEEGKNEEGTNES